MDYLRAAILYTIYAWTYIYKAMPMNSGYLSFILSFSHADLPSSGNRP